MNKKVQLKTLRAPSSLQKPFLQLDGPGLRKGKIQLVPTVKFISRVIPTEI